MNLFSQSATSLATLIRTRKISAVEVLQAHIDRIEALNPALNCFIDKTFSRAQHEAEAIDRKIASGEEAGALAGVPIAVKNLFDVAKLPTRAGSKIRRDAAPAKTDAPVLTKLIQAGAVLLGTLNMDEFASGFVTENAHDGPTHNPHDLARIAGGSSGGSAAAVAAGFAPLTLGSDTNGSIRVPAALCGVFGLKPTYGRIDRTGSFPFVDSFDHIGHFARDTADLALAYDLMQDTDKASPSLHQKIDPQRIAILDDWFEQSASAEILDAVAVVAKGLGTLARATLPEAGRARSAAFCISAFEGGQLHKPDLRKRPQDYDPATRPRLIAGALQPAETIYQAHRFRAWFRTEAQKLFNRFDVLLAPATPCVAPFIGQMTMMIDGLKVPVRANLGLYTQPISFIGLPVVCVPVAGSKTLPRGVQIITAPGREALGLAVAARLEHAGIVAAPVAGLSISRA
jgi:AtzE family amidohydrolase